MALRYEYLYQQAHPIHLSGRCRRWGEVAELGVAGGFSAYTLSLALPHRPLHLFDTFEGMPDLAREDKGETHDCVMPGFYRGATPEYVLNRFKWNTDPYIHKGIFKADECTYEGPFSFAHFDGDLYESAIEFIKHFEPLMLEGGMMMFHDYGATNCPGVKIAVHELFDEDRIQVANHTYCIVQF